MNVVFGDVWFSKGTSWAPKVEYFEAVKFTVYDATTSPIDHI